MEIRRRSAIPGLIKRNDIQIVNGAGQFGQQIPGAFQ